MNTNDGYNGNPLLKKPGTVIEWTPDILQEYVKCFEDPVYFAENYIKIVHVDKGLISLKLYDYQREIIESITNHRRVAVNTSRQAGKCVINNTMIKVRNKRTGKIKEITIGEFYENQKNNSKNDNN